MPSSGKAVDTKQNTQQKTLDPGLRRDDLSKAIGPKIVIPAQAGIQRR
jgi:hypothetical protein